MYFIGTVKNVKGEGLKDATVDVVSSVLFGMITVILTIPLTVASRRRRCVRHPVSRP